MLYVLATLAFGFGLTTAVLCWWADASLRELWAFKHPALRPTVSTRRELNEVQRKLALSRGEVRRLEQVIAARGQTVKVPGKTKRARGRRLSSSAPTQTFSRIHNPGKRS